MTQQIVVDPQRAKRYADRIAVVKANGNRAIEHIVEYWWNLWLIYQDGDWKAAVDNDGKPTRTLRDWLAMLAFEPYGTSHQTFYSKMGAIQGWIEQGMKEPGIRKMLGSGATMAIEHDIPGKLMLPGTNTIRPEVEVVIREGGETPVEAIQRIAELPEREARREVARLAGQTRSVFFSDPVWDESNGDMLCSASLMDDAILVGQWTLVITSRKVIPKPSKKPELPPEVAQALAGRLGLRL